MDSEKDRNKDTNTTVFIFQTDRKYAHDCLMKKEFYASRKVPVMKTISMVKGGSRTAVAIRERESDDQIRINEEKVAALVDLTSQVIRGKSTRNVLVREAKFYCATDVIVGVTKIKDYGYVYLCTIYSFHPKKLIAVNKDALL
nr:argonaute/Dicer protein, PAZ [Tanacetum cinerariifolium]